MPVICMLLRTPTEAHLKCLEGIRSYLAGQHLDWDLQMVDPQHTADAPADAWWVAFHSADLRRLPSQTAQQSTVLFGQDPTSCCRTDHEGFASLAVRHFMEQGYRTIGVVDGLPRQQNERLHQAVATTCRQHDLLFCHHRHTDPRQRDALVAWLRECPRPLALYAYSDPQAAWLRTLILEAGLRIPEDIALLGTGDRPMICLEKKPTLSSLAYPWLLMGEAAARHLHHRINGLAPPPPLLLRPYTVSVRDSSKKRGIRDPLVRRARAWLKQHLSSRRPLKEAAEHCGCSVQSLCLHFQAELAASPKQIHDQFRCEKAVELLTDPHRRMADIAKRSGFSSNTAFGVAFKRRYGCSPTQWRRATR